MAPGDANAWMINGAPMAEPQRSQRQFVPDERDAFISWLRGEFAAANAIIDALCQHLQSTGAPGEYDFVLACIHQRRYNWNPVLHMQQFYSVSEVLFSLQQVALKKHQGQVPLTKPSESMQAEQVKPGGLGLKQGNTEGIKSKEREENGINHGNSARVPEIERENSEDPHTVHNVPEHKVNHENGSTESLKDTSIKRKTSIIDEVTKSSTVPSGFEEIDGQQVNVMEGLELHENVLDSKEAEELAGLVDESHAAKRKTKTGGNKRSPKGKEKDLIHFGTIPAEIRVGQSSAVFKEETAEAMPAFLESVIDRLVESQIVPASKRPDSCSISALQPGDYMPPHNHHTFEQPICILSLGAESVFEFGRNLKISSTGEVNGKYKATLTVGSVLVLQGNSAELVQCAVSPLQSVRTLVTFGKIPRRSSPPLRTSSLSPSEVFGKQASRNANGFVQVPPGTRGYPASTATVPMVVPVSSVRSPGQMLQTQPMIIGSVGHVGPYSPVAVVAPGWSTSSGLTRVSSPGTTRVPSPGTGVFLPANGTVVYSTQHMNGSHRRQGASHIDPHSATSSNGRITERELVA